MKKFAALLLTLIMAFSMILPIAGSAALAADEYSSVYAGDKVF